MKISPSGRTILPVLIFLSAIALPGLHAASPPAEKKPAGEASQTDIPHDPRLVSGTLPNGFSYCILPTDRSAHQASFQLLVRAGSLDEADDERGYAHFVEHMVFHGSTHFPDDDLVPKMRQLGIDLGAHLSADTSLERTIYRLNLSDSNPKIVQQTLTVLRDFSGGATFPPQKIDQERQVIFAEGVASNTSNLRTTKAVIQSLVPDSRIAQRYPLGTEETLKAANHDRLSAFYRKHYTPDRMTLVAVGDFTPRELEEQIRDAFSDLTGTRPVQEGIDSGTFKNPDQTEAAVFVDSDLTSNIFNISQLRPSKNAGDSRQKREEILKLQLSAVLLNQRLLLMARGGDRMYDQATLRLFCDRPESPLPGFDWAQISITPYNDNWQVGLASAMLTLRGSLTYGFTDAEIKSAKADLLSDLQQKNNETASASPSVLADGILQTLRAGDIPCSSETSLEISEGILEKIGAEECRLALKQLWGDAPDRLFLASRQEVPGGKQAILDVYKESHDTPASDLRKAFAGEIGTPASDSFAYSTFGPAGSVASREELQDTKIVRYTLANGVRVFFRQTAFEKGSVQIQALFGSGLESLPRDKPGLEKASSILVQAIGWGKYTPNQMEDRLRGHKATARFSIEDESFSYTGNTISADLPLQLQILCAAISDPGFKRTEPELIESLNQQYRDQVAPDLIQHLLRSQAGAVLKMEYWLTEASQGLHPLDENQLKSYQLRDVRTWLTKPFADGSLDICVVGDITEDELLKPMLETFGALPKRSGTPAKAPGTKPLKFPKAPTTKTITFESKAPTGRVVVYWPLGKIISNNAQLCPLAIATQILQGRAHQQIRQEMGTSYEVNSRFGGTLSTNFAAGSIECDGKPEDLEKIAQTVSRLADKLAKDGVTQEEFEGSVKARLEQLADRKESNESWMDLITGYSKHPELLADFLGKKATYQSLTREDVNRYAAEYLKSSRAITMMIKSAAE